MLNLLNKYFSIKWVKFAVHLYRTLITIALYKYYINYINNFVLFSVFRA